jgi:hypothetical protein
MRPELKDAFTGGTSRGARLAQQRAVVYRGLSPGGAAEKGVTGMRAGAGRASISITCHGPYSFSLKINYFWRFKKKIKDLTQDTSLLQELAITSDEALVWRSFQNVR